MSQSRLAEIRANRIEKLAALRNQNINPYPSKYSQAAIDIFSARSKHNHTISVRGRIVRWREHGNVMFADIKDATGQIQLLFQKKQLGDQFSILKKIDAGDFLGVVGIVTTTQAGEITIDVAQFELLAKSLRPLPDDWHGLKDEEVRYRQRYVDLLLNEELKDLFIKKAIFWQTARDVMRQQGFLEVETPVLENTAGGADANPFVTHHDALDTDVYLRISTGELWQKRLMVAGFEKTFEIGRQFRNEGIDREHLQDYTQLEFYWAYANYEDSMKFVEDLYKQIAQKTFGTLEFDINNHHIDLSQSWQKINYKQAISEHLNMNITTATNDQLQAVLRQNKVEYSPKDSRGRLIDLCWKIVRKTISGPAFLVGHPVEVSPLAKADVQNPGFVERYQVILAGSEMGNGYSELNDPIDQAERFAAQQSARDQGESEAQMADADFIRALEYGMPPVTGFGFSERLFSFLANKPVRETVLFPLLRPESHE